MAETTYGTTVNSSPVDYRQSIYQSLIGRGLTPEQARGVLISLMGESGQGLNPKSYNPNDPGGAMGFAQWVGPRRVGLQATAKALGTTETDPTAQVAWFNKEISSPAYAPVLEAVKRAPDAAAATGIWTRGFEVPAKDNSAQRFAGNQNAIVIDKNGAPVFSTNAPAGSAPPSTAVASADGAGTAAAAPPAGQGLFGVGAGGQAATDKVTASLSALDKSLGGKGLGAEAQKGGQQGSPQIQASPIIPGPGAMGVSPLLATIPQTYGQTLNSMAEGAGQPAAPQQSGITPEMMAMLQQLAAQQQPQFPGGLV